MEGQIAQKNSSISDLTKKLDAVRVQLVRRQQLLAMGGTAKVSKTSMTTGEHKLQKELAELEIKVFQAQIKSLQAEKSLLMKDVGRLNKQIKLNGGNRYRTPDPDNS